MGVECVIYGATDREIGQLLNAPSEIHAFLRNATPIDRPGWIGTFLGRRPRPLPPTRPVFDLGKSWQAVHFVLNDTKNDAPLPDGFITSGGAFVGEEDVGYGPARVLQSDDVKRIAEMLSEVDAERFRSRIDAKKMRPLHVQGAPRSDDPGAAQFLVDDYDALRSFVMDRARSGDGIVIQFV